ncbi:hypothetical protein CCR75_000386 [Bremia lactucae]|uniref:Uncharacterized protein n=1 Tax=Bremia lactucae TaxID=4779 RepID=A0A976FPW5_BRELC|nr:hypothetical protein CCR75_000386 [Bremia lactucae]
MFSPWDLVRPTLWHPMSMLELSMMEPSRLLQPPVSVTLIPGISSDEEFFKDLPTSVQQQEKDESVEAENQKTFSSYSISSSTILDENGQKVMSTRRRYEDSSGRLKAEHEREVSNKRVKTVWNRMNAKDDGEHHTICSQVTPDEFEKLWSQTSFGKAQEKKHQELKESEEGVTSGQEQQMEVESAPVTNAP